MTVRPKISVIRVDLDGAGGTGAAFTLNASTGSVSLVAGSNITLSSNASTISIIGASGGTGGGAAFTLNASTGSVSLVSGAGISFSSSLSTITISNSRQFSTISLSASGNTTSSSSGTANNVLAVSGMGIVSVGVGNGSISISATTPSVTNYSTITATMAGNTLGAASTTLTIGNSLSISGAGAVSVGASAGTITISSPVAAAATNFSLNATSSSVSISAGAGIGIGQAASTITISASVQTANHSLSASGNTTGATSSGTYGSVLAVSGMGIVSVGAGNGTISISATTPSVTNYSTISGNIAGNTAGTSTFTIGNTLQISLTGGLSGTASGSSITLSGAAAAGAGVQSLSAGANSVTGTAVSLAIAAGTNISLATATGAGSLTVTISGSAQTSLTSNLPPFLSYTQNFPINEAVPIQVGTLTATGTTAASAAANPFGSSLSVQRLFIPVPMRVTEADLAFGISFPATNQGQGSMSQSLIVYSFGNSTSLASVMSASRAVTWATGTTTSGTSSSLQQGWASNNVQPFTFASTSLSAGEYAVAHLFSWAAASTSWTISVFGANNNNSLLAGSFHTGTTSTAITAFSAAPGFATQSACGPADFAATITGFTAITQNATNNVSWFVSRATSGTTSVASAISSFTFLEAPFVGSLATSSFLAATNVTNNSVQVLVGANVSTRTGAFNLLSSAGLSAGSFVTATPGFPSFAYNGSQAMTTNTTQASYLSGNFVQGLMATGSAPVSIDLKSTAVTVTGSTALIQPWFALAGS